MRDTTRLAPSPTGALHLGNARTFLVNWLLARKRGWRIALRIEDLDGPRIKAGADRIVMEDLAWLGIDWDIGPSYQSTRTGYYQAALATLLRNGQAFYCGCTRKEVSLAASAPHADDGAAVYPGTCRGKFTSREQAIAATGREPAVRFRVCEQAIEFEDGFVGKQRFDPEMQLGDFVIQKADGTAAYQLAVVVDDDEAGVTQVVRGDDLIDSTPRQLMIYAALGRQAQTPAYTHLPLIVGEDGRRLAKRHGDTRLSAYRAAGVSAGRVRSLLARWCGLTADTEVTLDWLLTEFELGRVPKRPIVFTRQDDAYLRGSLR